DLDGPGDPIPKAQGGKVCLPQLLHHLGIARAVQIRLELADRELVRRGSTLFSLPHNAADGAKAVWGTADAIWTALGDTSDDLNWYSKRATLSAVYGATVLFWLGDDSSDHHATWEFLDRRIDQVMQVEKLKASFRENPLGKALMAGPGKLFASIRAPKRPDDLPGHHQG
ncbi:MAG: COQ9 family protein, partial [Tabrizicola sp.]